MLLELYKSIAVEVVKEIMQIFKINLQDELIAQGHKLSGGLASDMDIVIKQDGDKITGTIFIRKYGIYIDRGVKASRIPYKAGSGRKKSKFIDALIDYFQKRGLSVSNAKGAAFATAKVQKLQGMPTRKSFRFSKNGRRTGFLEAGANTAFPKVFKIIRDYQKNELTLSLSSAITHQIFKAV